MKLTKQRLIEMAGLANLKPLTEVVSDSTEIEITLKTTVGDIKRMAAPYYNIEIEDQSELQAFTKEMEEDLNLWFQNNGDEWVKDGIDNDVYFDFVKRQD